MDSETTEAILTPDGFAAYTDTLGGQLRWRIRHGSTWVAAVRLADASPLVLLANHLEPGQLLSIYRTRSLEEVQHALSDADWAVEGSVFELDLTIPYTFYPIALPHWIAWLLFLLAMAGGLGVGVLKGRVRGWRSGLGAGSIGLVGLLASSMVVSMIITFFVHDL